MTETASTRATDATSSVFTALGKQIRRDGFAFVPAARMQALFAASGQPSAWNDDWQY